MFTNSDLRKMDRDYAVVRAVRRKRRIDVIGFVVCALLAVGFVVGVVYNVRHSKPVATGMTDEQRNHKTYYPRESDFHYMAGYPKGKSPPDILQVVTYINIEAQGPVYTTWNVTISKWVKITQEDYSAIVKGKEDGKQWRVYADEDGIVWGASLE